jgi:hypothetical protein
VDAAWVRAPPRTGSATRSQARRSTWQVWHVRGEAHRQVRAANLPAAQVEAVVDLVTDHTLTLASVRLTPRGTASPNPPELRRQDGSSVYEVAGSAVYTSQAILAAEQRLVHTAGLGDGHRASQDAVALLEQAANGVTLNPGQAALVTGMATSGPGSSWPSPPPGPGRPPPCAPWPPRGSRTAAPSSGSPRPPPPRPSCVSRSAPPPTPWPSSPGPSNTTTCPTGPAPSGPGPGGDRRGRHGRHPLPGHRRRTSSPPAAGQVRLIGDTQQLAAIGAGGVLRDIAATHGALHLDELMRFTDPAEGAASLALRDGTHRGARVLPRPRPGPRRRPRHHHHDVFTAWATDRNRRPGRDHARPHPRPGLPAEPARPNPPPGREGTRARGALGRRQHRHVGDTIITRANDRRLRQGCTDWVKNGDRWTVQNVHHDGSLGCSTRTGHHVTLPADYVTASTELGYATTIHGAQGISVDTMHGLATGEETRQQLYTMLTRGPHANHLYLQVVGDGDPHAIIRPTTSTRQPRPTSSRTSSPATTPPSPPPPPPATTPPPRLRLGAATARYLDASTSPPNTTSDPASPASRPVPTGSCRASPTTRVADPARPPHPARRHRHRPPHLHSCRRCPRARHRRRPRRGPGLAPGRHRPRNAGTGPLPWLPGIPQSCATTRTGAVPDRPVRPGHHARRPGTPASHQHAESTPPWWPPGTHAALPRSCSATSPSGGPRTPSPTATTDPPGPPSPPKPRTGGNTSSTPA